MDAWNYKPGIPRWARATIALFVAAAALALCIAVSHAYGATWEGWTGSLIFSILVFWVVEKLPVIGFDSLVSISAERWYRFKEWRKRNPKFDNMLGILSGAYFVKLIIRKFFR